MNRSPNVPLQSRTPRTHLTFKRTFLFILVCVLLFLMILASIVFGARDVSIDEVMTALAGSIETMSHAAVEARVPRTALAVIAGAALGLSGAVMQGVTRNVLADPGILGVNMGASLAIVVGIAYFDLASAYSYLGVAIVGAGVTVAFVYGIASMGFGGATPLKLALAGAATSIALSSFVVAIVLPRNDIAGGVRSWQIGGVGGATFERIELILPILLIGFVLSLSAAKTLNALALGDDVAAGFGENVAWARLRCAAGAILLCGATTALCGPIGFVGLVVPHVARLLVGLDHRWLLPFSCIGGAVLLLSADIIGRVVTRPSEIDVGIITALVGAPVFIWIVRYHRMRDL